MGADGGGFDRWVRATADEDRFPTPRSIADGGVVTLREITGETVRAMVRLQVRPDQASFVAPNAVSIAQACFEPMSWLRAVYADETPVGLVLLEREPDAVDAGLWRFMIAAPYQRSGYGRRALELVVEELLRDPKVTTLATSWSPDPQGPEPFYLGFGFVKTGEVDDGEIVGRLALRS